MTKVSKNILIFSDGTGQAGGIAFDEDRTNIYKLYRATRCGPDSCIDPKEQVAFYDPGLGSPADEGPVRWKRLRWIYRLASQATGLGLTENIIDAYAAIIRLYKPGDRIFLFGFSRGAYTVRCLGGVIAMCGIPTRMPDESPVPLDHKGSRKLAANAVRNVYQFCSSKPRKEDGSYTNFMLNTRSKIAARFRTEHGSSDPSANDKANVYPYFIGVFDTVAAIGSITATAGLVVGIAFATALAALAISLLHLAAHAPYIGWLLAYLTPENVLSGLFSGLALWAACALARNYIKFDFRVPEYGLWKSIKTIHIANLKQRFTDYGLNPNVTYAKHAIAMDENRKDFKRVPWIPTGARQERAERDRNGNIFFEQVWFAGVHADIGGGYPENESRLSDISLGWMLAAASAIPDGIVHDPRVLCLYPDPAGPQHDECKAGWWRRGVRSLPADKTGTCRVVVHRSVYERFATDVVQYDRRTRYLPENMREHVDFRHYWTRAQPPRLVAEADNIEYRWAQQKKAMRQAVPPIQIA